MSQTPVDGSPTGESGAPPRTALLVVTWLFLVIIPLLYGLIELIAKLGALGG